MYKSRVLSTLDFKYVGFKCRQPVLRLLAIIIYMMIQFNSDTNSPGLTQIKAKALTLQVCLYFRYKPQVQATHISYKKRIPVISPYSITCFGSHKLGIIFIRHGKFIAKDTVISLFWFSFCYLTSPSLPIHAYQ